MDSFPETFNDQNPNSAKCWLRGGVRGQFPETFNDLKGLYVYQTAD